LQILQFIQANTSHANSMYRQIALERGHPYRAFTLNRFSKWDASTRELILADLPSTFNPYQVQVMRTRLRLPCSDFLEAKKTVAGLPENLDWIQIGVH